MNDHRVIGILGGMGPEELQIYGENGIKRGNTGEGIGVNRKNKNLTL